MGVLIALLIAILPKCPLCGASYLSLLGVSSVSSQALHEGAFPLLIILFIVNLLALAKRARKRQAFIPVYLSVAGFILIRLAKSRKAADTGKIQLSLVVVDAEGKQRPSSVIDWDGVQVSAF